MRGFGGRNIFSKLLIKTYVDMFPLSQRIVLRDACSLQEVRDFLDKVLIGSDDALLFMPRTSAVGLEESAGLSDKEAQSHLAMRR